MRRYDEAIDVRVDEGEGEPRPARFIWRRRLWRVLGVEARWRETADWWSRPGGDLLAESEVWCVVAADGRSGTPGVFELACAEASGGSGWRLRGVLD